MAQIELSHFDVTANGFLPNKCPLKHLENEYYTPWEDITLNLPDLIRRRTLRPRVLQLSILTTEHLQTEAEWRRAHTMLVFIAHAYIWGGDEPEEVLPPPISIPLLSTARHVELPPVLTCATVNLWNYTLNGQSLSNPDDLEIHTTFTGTQSEAWFLAVGTAIEAKGACLIQPLIDALLAVQPKNYAVVNTSLCLLADTLREMALLLDRMHEKCDPMTFCHQIRPFYAGSKGVSRAGLPRGVLYDEGQGIGQWLQLPGGSNGQSALLQLIDIVLGIGYSKSNKPARQREGYFYNTRECTPGSHRRFLAIAGDIGGSIRELCLDHKAEQLLSKQQARERGALRDAYEAAANAMAHFRTTHVQIVARFVALPLRQPWKGSHQSIAMPTLLPSGLRENAKYGTAGMPTLQFLKALRDETLVASKLTKSGENSFLS